MTVDYCMACCSFVACELVSVIRLVGGLARVDVGGWGWICLGVYVLVGVSTQRESVCSDCPLQPFNQPKASAETGSSNLFVSSAEIYFFNLCGLK